MSKKSLILCIVAAVLLLAGIGVALAFLYSGSGAPKKVAPPVRSALLSAVPSDAAAVICSSDLQTGAELLPAGIVPDFFIFLYFLYRIVCDVLIFFNTNIFK